MTVMADRKLLKSLDHLVGEEGFRSRKELISLALSIGLFMDERCDGRAGDIAVEPTTLSNWPLVQVIVHHREPSILTMEEMGSYVEPYLNRGLEIMVERVGSQKGDKALLRLASFLPP